MSVLVAANCVAQAQVYGTKPCDSTVEYENRNMVDYTVKVRRVRGRVVDPFNNALAKACIAVFNEDHSKLLRTVESDDEGNFSLDQFPPGRWWLIVKDQQRAFCPAAAKLKVGRLKGKSTLVVHMKVSGIDTCSFCQAK